MRINLASLISSHLHLEKNLFKKYINNYGIQIKNQELEIILEILIKSKKYNFKIKNFDDYFVGYTIPQIGKEFDLLKVNDSQILNLELKSKSNLIKIKEQLLKNKYYLGHLDKELLLYTYESHSKKIFFLNNEEDLIETKEEDFFKVFLNFEANKIENLDSVFTPSNYLVSPFNSTEKFIGGEYFLNNQQFEYKTNTLKKLANKKKCIISICGEAGSGKTLLTYDITKELINNGKNTLVFHCGILNSGHLNLINKFKWEVSKIANIAAYNFENINFVVLDEAQRIRSSQLNFLLRKYEKHNFKIILSYDYRQTLSIVELRSKIYISLDKISDFKFTLTHKIRTNKELSSFIKRLFHKNKPVEKLVYDSVNLIYFRTSTHSINKLKELSDNGFKIINYTPSIYDNHPYDQYNIKNMDTCHKVLGQEFEKIAVIIDEHFYYKNNVLSSRGYLKKPYYHPTKMLYQIVSRATTKLTLIIINNPTILERALDIKSGK